MEGKKKVLTREKEERRNMLLDGVLAFFLAERPKTPCPSSVEERRKLLRALLNTREVLPIPEEVQNALDELLQLESREKGVVCTENLPNVRSALGSALPHADRMILWKGDITRLNAEAIVNAANSAMLGCFLPLHNCIDNVIHSAAGPRLRQACHDMMLAEYPDGTWREPAGHARATTGFNLPCRYVFHTVGPVVQASVTERERSLLTSCYTSCLNLAFEKSCRSLAFCCISTGEFRFPKEEAARIAVSTVTRWMDEHPECKVKIIFNVFTEQDNEIYTKLLSGVGR